MELLKKRKTPLSSKRKIASAINLYEKYVDEPIETIKIWSSTYYTIKGKDEYNVDISTNKVVKNYPDPE